MRNRFLSPFFVIWWLAIVERGFGMTFDSVNGSLPDYLLKLHNCRSTFKPFLRDGREGTLRPGA